VSRWKLVLSDYTAITNLVSNNEIVLEETGLTFFPLNEGVIVSIISLNFYILLLIITDTLESVH